MILKPRHIYFSVKELVAINEALKESTICDELKSQVRKKMTGEHPRTPQALARMQANREKLLAEIEMRRENALRRSPL